MEKIAVISAMNDEAAGIVEKLGLKKREPLRSGALVFGGIYNNKEITVTVCRVGKVAAAMTAEEIILGCSPDMIINLGIAGGVAPGIVTGNICVSDGFVQYDYDLSPLGMKRGELDEFGFAVIKADPSLSDGLFAAAKAVYADEKCRRGIIATGDTFVSSADFALSLRSDFGAVACDMEGAAIAFVCYLNKLPFAAIRAISDNANEKSAVDFNTFRKQAVENSTEIICRFLADR